jgi:hypothetical protein
MKLFGRNSTGPSSKAQGEAQGSAPPESVTHLFTMDLARAETLAIMMANSRATSVVEVTDLLAGMYIHDWERLSKYWDYQDQEHIENILRQICEISPQRWHYWIEFYDQKRRDGEERDWLRTLLPRKTDQLAQKSPRYSAALSAVLAAAEQISPFRDSAAGRDVPVLTSESVLLGIVRSPGSELSRKLIGSGLNTSKLEKVALSSRRAPRGHS